MAHPTADLETYRDDFARAEREVLPGLPAWLRNARREAMSRFALLGFPAPSDERWRQTPVAELTRAPFRAAAPGMLRDAEDLVAEPLADLGAPRIVFVNGRYASDLSTPPSTGGVFAGSLAAGLVSQEAAIEERLGRIAPHADRAFTALNTALSDDVAIVLLRDGADVPDPIHVVHLTIAGNGPLASYPRTLVIAGRSSRATVIESYLGRAREAALTCAVTEIDLAAGARLEHCRIQTEPRAGYHVGSVHAHQGRDSRLVSMSVALGAAIARLDLGSVLAGEGADCEMNGLYVADGERHMDHRTEVDHASPHGTSRQTYRGILGGAARAVFCGRIRVAPGAQKTDAFQSNRNLLLSEDALVHTRPQLEIHADDVRCTHGATVGQLDANALFYLRSRGIALRDARRLLTEAFSNEVLRRIGFVPLRNQLAEEASVRTAAAAGNGGAR